MNEREDRCRQLAELLPQLVWMCRADGQCDYLNPQWVKYTGIPESGQLGMGWVNQLHPEDRERTIAGWNAAVGAGSSFAIEFRIRRNDSICRWFSANAIPLRDNAGRVAKWFGSATDIEACKRPEQALQLVRKELQEANDKLQAEIAARRRSEDALRRNEKRFSEIAKQSRTVTWEVNAAGLYTYMSDVSEAVFGYRADELVGKKYFYDLHPESGRAAFKAEALGVFDRKEPFVDLVNSFQAKDGRILWVSTCGSPVLGDHGELLGYRGADEDITERKRMETALRESEANFRHSLDDAPLGVRIVTAEGATIYANRAILDIYGFSNLEEFRAIPVEKRYTAESYLEFKKRYKLRQQGKDAPSEYEVSIVRKNGEIRHLLVSRKRLLWNGKKQYQTLYRDITKHKLAEEALKKSEALFRSYFELPLHGIAITSTKKRWRQANDQLCAILGYSREEILRMTWTEMTHPDDLALDLAQFNRIMSGQIEQYKIEKRFIRKDGTVVWTTVSVGCVRKSDGDVDYIVCVIDDITERKKTEEALRESEMCYRTFIESTSDLVFLKDESFRYLISNVANNVFLGQTEATVIGRTDFDLMPYEAAAHCRASDQQALALGGIAIGEEVVGSDTYQSIKFPVPLSRGRIGVGGYIRNITNRKRAEAEKAELEAQNWQLQKAESLSRMAGAIAHQFNNQLQTVLGSLELAMSTHSIASLTDAMQATRKASEISHLMLTYLGKTPGKRDVLDLADACRLNLPLLRAAIPKRVVLEADLPSPGPVISANADQVQQILNNLVTNAWEAMGDGAGAIHLTVKTVSSVNIVAEHCRPVLWQPQGQDYACLEVTDTGDGIAPKDIEQLFDPFFSTKFIGRGLGLPVVLGIVRSYDGCVTAGSMPSRGSVFRVFLPVCAQDVPPTPDHASPAPKYDANGMVLVVEDEQFVRKVTVMMLARMGFKVLEAKDGVEAIKVFRQHLDEVRCVLCDLSMPRMNGWDTIAALRALRPDLPVILASGYDEASVMVGDHSERPQIFLGKPYTQKELGDALGRALEGARKSSLAK